MIADLLPETERELTAESRLGGVSGYVRAGRAIFDSDWRKRSELRPNVSRSEIDWMVKAHYLRKWPGVVVARFGLLVDGSPCGMILYALPPRETSTRFGGVTWELARLWIADSVPFNAETWVISQSVKWIKCQRPEIQYLVSYADPTVGHRGVIYKAANWRSDGRTEIEGRKTPRCDYQCLDTGKKYSRKSHVPAGARVARVPRASKFRYVLQLRHGHNKQI